MAERRIEIERISAYAVGAALAASVAGVCYSFGEFVRFGYNYASLAGTSDLVFATFRRPLVGLLVLAEFVVLSVVYLPIRDLADLIVAALLSLVLFVALPGYAGYVMVGLRNESANWLSWTLTGAHGLKCLTLDAPIDGGTRFVGAIESRAGEYLLVRLNRSDARLYDDTYYLIRQSAIRQIGEIRVERDEAGASWFCGDWRAADCPPDARFGPGAP